MVDGDDKYWLVAGMERGGSFIVRLMRDASVEIDGYPPENLVVGEQRFGLDKRGTATVTSKGETGLGRPNTDGLATAERCRWWSYDTPGEDTLIVEQWGNAFRVIQGAKVSSDIVDMIPGS